MNDSNSEQELARRAFCAKRREQSFSVFQPPSDHVCAWLPMMGGYRYECSCGAIGVRNTDGVIRAYADGGRWLRAMLAHEAEEAFAWAQLQKRRPVTYDDHGSDHTQKLLASACQDAHATDQMRSR